MTRSRLIVCIPLALVVGILSAGSGGVAVRQQSAAASADRTSPVRFVAFGDMGTGDNDQMAVARQMVAHHDAHPYDTVLTVGDNIYPDGNPADLAAKFERPYAELLRRGVNFYATLGNNDVKKGRDAQINYQPFHMGGRAYYSFTKGTAGANQVQLFAIDSTKFDAAQERWLDTSLAESKARWKIAFFHHAIYSSAKTHGSRVKLRAQLEPLFVKHGVAAVFSGHDHTYERTTPQQGVQYFVCGIGGTIRAGDLDRSSPFLAFGSDEDSGFMSVEVTADRMDFQAINAAGQVFDRGTIAPRVAPPVTGRSGDTALALRRILAPFAFGGEQS
jgi:3',5'-cyclic AMP phosphodiesterase CpdA